jgi:cytochrome c-type biogenesis protein CcmH/NrfG
MSVHSCVVLCIGAALIVSGQRAAAQAADVHARATARASCQSGKHSDAVADAKSATERSPDDLGPRLRLADALVDQGCYQEALAILESAQEGFPRNSELSGKLRDVRSLVTEQTYIEGLTQAAESAKFSRNQLRCTKLGDVTACEDALHSKPDDVPLLLAKGDALMQANRVADAVTAYHHVSQLKPNDEAIKGKLANAEALQANIQAASSPAALPTGTAPTLAANRSAAEARRKSGDGTTAAGTAAATGRAGRQRAPAVAANARQANTPGDNPGQTAAGQPNGGQRLTATPTAAVAALSPPDPKTYSNDAPPGQTN